MKRKKWVWIIIAIVLAVLALMGLVIFSFMNSMVMHYGVPSYRPKI